MQNVPRFSHFWAPSVPESKIPEKKIRGKFPGFFSPKTSAFLHFFENPENRKTPQNRAFLDHKIYKFPKKSGDFAEVLCSLPLKTPAKWPFWKSGYKKHKTSAFWDAMHGFAPETLTFYTNHSQNFVKNPSGLTVFFFGTIFWKSAEKKSPKSAEFSRFFPPQNRGKSRNYKFPTHLAINFHFAEVLYRKWAFGRPFMWFFWPKTPKNAPKTRKRENSRGKKSAKNPDFRPQKSPEICRFSKPPIKFKNLSVLTMFSCTKFFL